MKEYIQFISRVLWACFFMALIGAIILILMGYDKFMLGWVWGIGIMVLYVLLLVAQARKLVHGDPLKEVRKTGIRVVERLALVGAFSAVGLQIDGVEALSMVLAIILMQPVLFVMYWKLSNK